MVVGATFYPCQGKQYDCQENYFQLVFGISLGYIRRLNLHCFSIINKVHYHSRYRLLHFEYLFKTCYGRDMIPNIKVEVRHIIWTMS